MKKFKLYVLSVLLLTASNISQATEILEIPVEDETECTLPENIELFKKIEQEQSVKIECVLHDGHIYGPALQSASPPITFKETLQQILKNIYDRITFKKHDIEDEEDFSSNQTEIQEEDNASDDQIEIQNNEIEQQEFPEPITEVDYSILTTETQEDFVHDLPNYPLNIHSESTYTYVNTFFATDRAVLSIDGIPIISNPYKQFTNEIYQGTSSYQLGVTTVTIPKNKQPGISNKAGFWVFNPNPEHHSVLWNNEILSSQQFFKTIQQNPNKKSFIFIHGYNVSFSKAAIQTAELTYDLKFVGTPIFYAWPSKAKVLGYFADQETLQSSQQKFADFLTEYITQAPQELYLIAHSMGSQALLKTLEQQLPHNPQLRQHLKGIIFVAPDVAVTKFNEELKKLHKFNIPVTLYGSQKDLALALSETISSQQRAGYLNPIDDLVKVKGLDVIDATPVQTDFLGHALSPMSSDISELMIHKVHAKLRSRLKAMLHKNGTYYVLNEK